MNVQVIDATPKEAYQVAASIPEFSNNAYDLTTYQKRLVPPCSILVAIIGNTAAGFKAGYQRGAEECFYSWMGGVLPEFRRLGVALRLAEHQESWAKAQGFKKLWFKTRNQNRAMLQFALSRQFNIIEVIPRAEKKDYRIILEKTL